ncbi:MAG: hypothetical protein IKT61_01280 [Clostridia bacterium]|nr:hypothetical protein [Clostridia bacterium]
MKEKKTKIKTAVIIAVSLVAIILSVLVIVQAVPKVRLNLAEGGTVCDGVLPGVDEALHITDVPEGEIRYLINKQMVFGSPYSLGDVMLENPEACGYDLQFVVYNTQGEMIYTSPIIKPGQYLEKDKLTTVVKSGTYNCSYSALAYRDGELMGEVNGIVNVTVK